MYLKFYGFKEAPFNLTPDSKFLFLSHRHQEALASLLFGVQERKGFICLTGEIGCGKTTLCRAMLGQLDPDKTRICLVLNSYLTDLELLKTINEEYGLPAASESKKELIDELNRYLVEQFEQDNNVVLIIDESQNLRPEALEQIRMISNLETETAKLIQIVMIGQPELRRTLGLPELEQLNQRITVRYHLTPLDENEISDYIRHRLAVAEPQVEVNFTERATKLIYHFSRGVPRRINVICDRCLLMGYTQGTFEIDDKIVQKAVDEVRGEMQSAPAKERNAAGLGDESAGLPGWLGKCALMVMAVVIIALSILLGQWLSQKWLGQTPGVYMAQPAQTQPAPDQAQPLPAADFPLGGDEPMEQVSAHTVATASPAPQEETPSAEEDAQPTATPAPTPRPTPILYEDWQRDADQVLRVQTPGLSEAAAYITLVGLWNIEIELDTFRNAPAKEVAQYDMLEMVKQLNFKAVVTEELTEALRLDLPTLVRMDESDEYAPFAVIASLKGNIVELIDPIHGRKMVRRETLQPHIKRAYVLFQDPDGVGNITMGEQSGRVQMLQGWLASQGHYEAKIDGKFGYNTREAIQKLQSSAGLEATGDLDLPTTALITSLLNPRRPRLYS